MCIVRLRTVAISGLLLVACLALGACQEPHPLGQPPRLKFPKGAPQSARIALRAGDFSLVTNVNELPSSVRRQFQEQGGTRLLIANPGEEFSATDVITNASLPRQRLIFAGSSENATFVFYERGGRGLSYVIDVFGIRSGEIAEPVWRGYCHQTVDNLDKLRREIVSGGCS
jgi:hypothetical protein